jgi:hypothetical protein
LLKARILRWHPLAGHLASRRNPQVRPITGGNPSTGCTFGDQLIRVYGTTAVNTGYYTFTYVKDGETKILPARYSFTYVKNGENWLIVDHHSSAMPQAPK